MAQAETKSTSGEGTQRTWARIAGFVFLWLIITDLAGLLTVSHIVRSGDFAETARRVVASEDLYGIPLSSELVESVHSCYLLLRCQADTIAADRLSQTPLWGEPSAASFPSRKSHS